MPTGLTQSDLYHYEQEAAEINRLTNPQHMKFTPVEKAKVPFDKILFVKDTKGMYHAATLYKEEKTAGGVVKTFHLATFEQKNGEDPVFTSAVTHVAVP